MESINRKLEQLTKELEKLQNITEFDNNSQKKKYKEVLIDLERKISQFEAFLQLYEGQPVTDGKQLGVITQLSLSPGGMPEVWVSWCGQVPSPEAPERLKPEPVLTELKVSDRIVINSSHPTEGDKTFEVKEFKGNGWILTTNDNLFHADFFTSEQKPKILMLKISLIRRDGGTQPRAEINQAIASEYAEEMHSGAVFPPVLVFDDGINKWLVDGFHRVLAAESLGKTEIAAEIRQGTKREAILESCKANSAHGLRRSNEDKRRAVMTLLQDSEWSIFSSSQIAKLCGVSHTFVNKLRSLLETFQVRDNDFSESNQSLETFTDNRVTRNVSSETRAYIDRHGNKGIMKTGKIGKSKQFTSVEDELKDKEKRLGLRYNRKTDQVLPSMPSNPDNPNPDNITYAEVDHTRQKIEANLNDILIAFSSNIGFFSPEQLQFIGEKLATLKAERVEIVLKALTKR